MLCSNNSPGSIDLQHPMRHCDTNICTNTLLNDSNFGNIHLFHIFSKPNLPDVVKVLFMTFYAITYFFQVLFHGAEM